MSGDYAVIVPMWPPEFLERQGAKALYQALTDKRGNSMYFLTDLDDYFKGTGRYG